MPNSLEKLYQAGYEAVIGLEIHVQLNTESKIFSWDANALAQQPNSHVSPISLAHPGTLPMLNEAAVRKAALMSFACHCELSTIQHFDRKSYFYPDLPKGYQTTQDKQPMGLGGRIELFGTEFQQKEVELHHIHLEEDAGKSIHEKDASFIDLNRAGAPLIEMVTEPCIKGPEEAAACLQEIRRMVRYLNVGNANMERGELRCDANISIRPKGQKELGNKVEIKNMNSFNHMKRACYFELERQLQLSITDQEIVSETRTFDPNTGKTHGMRVKESMNDYRYFPCPDLPPWSLDKSLINELKEESLRPPSYFRDRFKHDLGLSDQDISVLTEEKETALYFNALASQVKDVKSAANWMNGPLRALVNEEAIGFDELGVSPERLADLINRVVDGQLAYRAALQEVLPRLRKSEKSVLTLSQELDLLIVEDSLELQKVIHEVLVSLPKEVEAFKKGKKKLMGLFMGEVMKKTKGKANPKKVQEELNKALS